MSQRPGFAEPEDTRVSDWLRIETDGSVTVLTGKVEVGQGIRTSLAQVVAEELRMPLGRVRVLMGDTDAAPFDMGTFGSRTTPTMAPRLRRAAAQARELLLDLAAREWDVARDELVARDGKVVHAPTGKCARYCDLTHGSVLDALVSEDAPLTPPEEWQVIGKPVPRVNARNLVTGRHEYASDLTLPGAHVGRVLRPPAPGAVLVSLDTSRAEAMNEVTVVNEEGLVGVVAPDTPTAARALAAIEAEWELPRRVPPEELFEHLKTHPPEPDPEARFTEPVAYEQGDVGAGLDAAERTLRSEYQVAYIAHAPLETRAALAQWKRDRLTVWTGTQRPFGVRAQLAEAFGVPEEQVRVIVPDTGSGYGGKHTGEAAVEAARLARVAARPVKLIWTRPEEFTFAYFRPAGVIEVTSGVGPDGTLTSWEFHNYNSGAAGIQSPYAAPNERIVFHPAESPFRQGSYRALAATANHFARESHIDELAHALGADPLEFRLRNLADERVRAVLEAAAERFGWRGVRVAGGRGFGLACGTEKGSCVATCAEVEVDGSAVRVIRVVEAFECGAIVNPENLRNQVEGAIVQGLGGALFEAIQFDDRGRILTDRFSRYRVPRFADAPEIEVVLLDRRDLPSAGAGETPIVGIAPAVANAIFSATGRRLRSLPLAAGGVPMSS